MEQAAQLSEGRTGLTPERPSNQTRELSKGMAVNASTLESLTPDLNEDGVMGGNDTELRDKVIKLETNFEHFQDRFKHMEQKVDQMHEIVLKAKGIKWFIGAMALVGGFVASKFGTFLVSLLTR